MVNSFRGVLFLLVIFGMQCLCLLVWYQSLEEYIEAWPYMAKLVSVKRHTHLNSLCYVEICWTYLAISIQKVRSSWLFKVMGPLLHTVSRGGKVFLWWLREWNGETVVSPTKLLFLLKPKPEFRERDTERISVVRSYLKLEIIVPVQWLMINNTSTHTLKAVCI